MRVVIAALCMAWVIGIHNVLVRNWATFFDGTPPPLFSRAGDVAEAIVFPFVLDTPPVVTDEPDIDMLNCQKGDRRRTNEDLTAFAALILGLAMSGMAAEFKGFVEDTDCGSPAVLVAARNKSLGGERPARWA